MYIIHDTTSQSVLTEDHGKFSRGGQRTTTRAARSRQHQQEDGQQEAEFSENIESEVVRMCLRSTRSLTCQLHLCNKRYASAFLLRTRITIWYEPTNCRSRFKPPLRIVQQRRAENERTVSSTSRQRRKTNCKHSMPVLYAVPMSQCLSSIGYS